MGKTKHKNQDEVRVSAPTKRDQAYPPAGLYYINLGVTNANVGHGMVVQYKPSLDCFTMPGNSRDPVGYPVFCKPDEPQIDSPVELIDGRLVSAEPYPEQTRRDRFWSDVAKLRAAGKPFSHMFGEIKRQPPATMTLRFRSGASLDCVMIEIVRRVDRLPRPKVVKLVPSVETEVKTEATKEVEVAQ